MLPACMGRSTKGPCFGELPSQPFPANSNLLDTQRASTYRSCVDSPYRNSSGLESPLQLELLYISIEMDGGTISASAVSSIFTATLRISQVIYELKAVGEQTRDLLDSTTHVETSLEAVRTLRRQKSCHLDVTEKRWIDDVLINTEKTLGNVAALIEPARVDMQTKFGRVGFVNRGLFVFRDSPKVGTNLSRLNLASQSLNTAMNILCMREGRAIASPIEKTVPHRSSVASLRRTDALPPPTYIESEFLNRRRHTHISKRPVTRCSSTTSLRTGDEKADSSIAVVNLIDLIDEENKPAETIENPTLEDNVTAVPLVVTVQEVNPTPVELLQKNPFDEAGGLEISEATYFQSPTSQTFDFADGPQICHKKFATSPRISSFDGADGLEVCKGKISSSSLTQERTFHEDDGLQVCNAWNAPTPVQQNSTVELLKVQSGQQNQLHSSQWHKQRSSYQRLPYPISEGEQLLAGPWHNPQWERQHTVDRDRQISQSQNSSYPNPPYPNLPYQNTSNQNCSYQDPSFQNPPHPSSLYPGPPHPNPTLQHQLSFQCNQNQPPQWKQLPLLPRRPVPSSDHNLRPSSISMYATSDRPISQDTGTTVARKSLATDELTKSPSSISPSLASRRASQASTSSWTTSEVSQAPSLSTRRRAWLEFQSER